MKMAIKLKIPLNETIIINFKTWKSSQIFIKPNIFHGICMFWQHKKYTYISLKHNWVYLYRFAWKANDSRGIHVYLKGWQNKHIHEMKVHDHNTNPKREYKFRMYKSSKLGYTNTSNGHK